MNNKLLIVGVDPGTTLGYAVLDIHSNLIKTKSSKQLNLNSLISEVTDLGKVVVVGTDKAKVPSLVELFSVKTGGRTIRPEEDLKVEEKKKLISNYKVRDDHQADALASALFAYKKTESLLKKIEVFAKNNKKSDIRDKIINLVLTKSISIKQAVDIIEKPEKEDVKIIKKVVEDRELRQGDFLKLYNKVKRYEKEVLFLRKRNNNLDRELKMIFDKYRHIAKKVDKLKSDEKVEELINFKEKRIKFFDKEFRAKDGEIDLLFQRVNNLNFILSKLNENYLLKKLNNLGNLEFESKNRFLNIKENDILLIENPNIFNNKVIEKLKGIIKAIVYKEDLNKTTKSLPFIFIDGRNLNLIETRHFAIINRKVFDKEFGRANILEKVVEEYKQECHKSL